ncbi:MAG: hypothetical protein WDA11_02885 [Thiohalomonadaceae bacterium]
MKLQVLFILAVLLVGMWMGVNIARDKPLFSNPFTAKTLTEKARDAADGFLKKFE